MKTHGAQYTPIIRLAAATIRLALWLRYRIKANGIEKIIELDLNDEEKELLEVSRGHVQEVMDVLDKMS